MNTLLFSPQEMTRGCLYLGDSDPRFVHVKRVLRGASEGRIRVGELGGTLGLAQVRLVHGELGRGSYEVIPSLGHCPPPPSTLSLVLALPRPKAFGRILESATELGVKKIAVIHGARVEKSYWQAHQLKESEVRKHLLAGLSLSNDTILPQVEFHRRLRPFVEDRLLEFSAGNQVWVAHPGEADSFGSRFQLRPNCNGDSGQRMTLVVGPEGGWQNFELDLWTQQGAQLFRLGDRVLSSESAVPALLGALSQSLPTSTSPDPIPPKSEIAFANSQSLPADSL